VRHAFLFSLLIAALAFAYGPADWQSLGGRSDEDISVRLLESDFDHLLLEIEVPGFWLYDYPAEGQVWQKLELYGCAPHGTVGLPEVLSWRKLFAMPFGTTPELSVESAEYSTFDDVDLLPRQRAEVDMPHAPYPFEIDQAYYSSGRVFPGSWANVDNEGIWSGLKVGRLNINPFRYDPETGQLMAASRIRVRVDFTGQMEAPAYPSNRSMFGAYRDLVINFADYASAAQADGADDAPEYVFLVNSGNIDDVTPLIEHHNAMGLKARVETLSNPSDPGEMMAAIADNYDTGVMRFALIAGDDDAMPSYDYGSHVGDFYYTLITGGDNYPEIAIGRLTGDEAQIALQVDKTIDGYINFAWADQNTTGITPSETVLCAHEENYPDKYTQCCEEIAAYDYSLCDITFSTLYPPEGATADDLEEIINNDVGTVGYRGHGDVTYWSWSPGWNSSNINSLTNDFLPPVFNIACYCGRYNESGTCLAEAWQWADNGCYGNLAATNPSYTTPNHDYMKRIYRGLYDEGLYRIGEAINYSTEWIIDNHPTYGLANAKMYIWFGDPAVDTWTNDDGNPTPLDIVTVGHVNPGPQDITVTVNSEGSPVEGANVTICDGVDGLTTLSAYEEGTTNSSGQVTITVDVPESGELTVGAFKHDYTFDTDVIEIWPEAVEENLSRPYSLHLNNPAPNPVTVSASIGYGMPDAGHVELSVFDVTGRKVKTLVSGEMEAGNYVYDWTPGDITSGVYFIRLTTPEGTLTRQAMVIR
jgi:hypothetical protein